ncbi:patatin-like phospholipase family protein [Flavobacterium ardleyense]|uniref:Patatin-like phospholipase family protein n=1 Tax=Flavobacterium ardleyense TaxID=2038737 RepID=A0ABW5Z849_9FLAO
MTNQFNTAFILSGGGTRLMIYLGMYAALEELQMKPDVLIGTCGGAFATTVINSFSDNASRKEYMKSDEYFKFVTQVQLTKEKKLSRIGLLCLRKIQEKRNAPFIEDVFSKYLVEMKQDLASYFPTLANTKFSKEIPTILVGSEILFDREMTGQARANKKLYEKVLFTDETTASQINIEKIGVFSENYQKSAVSTSTKIRTDISMLTGTRISVTDMFYVPPVSIDGKYYAGGAIDLIPVELAQHIAKSVIIERKQTYSPVEEALVRAVLGYSGNQRLASIQAQGLNLQIDTNNIKKELKGHYVKKDINWKKLEIAFSFPKSHKQFRSDMDKQWQYGFNQTIASLQAKK